MENYSELIGKYILCFGGFETTIYYSIIEICLQFYDRNIILNKILIKMLASISGISKKVQVLEYIISLLDLSEQTNNEWKDFFKATYKLIEKRNIYAHNMYGVSEDTFYKFTNKRNARGISIEKEIPFSSIKNDVKELEERYRQLFDSMIEKDCIWISCYPKLKLR